MWYDPVFSRLNPARPLALAATQRLRLGSFRDRLRISAFERPYYAYCIYHAADLATKLGYTEVSVIEYGVACGNGLLLVEQYADEVADELGIKIQVYGFDTGTGLPAPDDYRDLPYHWRPGFFRMDENALRPRLRRAQLVIGDIRDTAETFFDRYQPAPIAAVLHDLDFYSSTRVALEMFNVEERYRLPRIFCYFDDIIGEETELYNDFTGERLAILEFNADGVKKLSPAYHLITRADPKQWYYQIFLLHDFEHSKYCDFISECDQQLPLQFRGDWRENIR
jgi:hypothetical protein